LSRFPDPFHAVEYQYQVKPEVKLKLQSLLEKWGLTSLKIKLPFLEAEITVRAEDQSAAWELYIEMLTRVATQDITVFQGDESSALESLHKLFALTREIIKRNGVNCITFAKISVVILNQRVRPFTTKWHPVVQNLTHEQRLEFRSELKDLQVILRRYMRLLADLAQGCSTLSTHLQS
jgi:hypothetical protein